MFDFNRKFLASAKPGTVGIETDDIYRGIYTDTYLAYRKYISHQKPLIYLQSPGPSIPLQSGIPERSSQRLLDQSDQQPYLGTSRPIVPTDTTRSLHLFSTIRHRFWTHTHCYSIGPTRRISESKARSSQLAHLLYKRDQTTTHKWRYIHAIC